MIVRRRHPKTGKIMWAIVSHRAGRVLGYYKSKREAEERLKQLQRWKRRKRR